jgi:hypothetical protein
MQKQYIGSEVTLSNNSPLTVRDDGPTGKVEMELIGDTIPMSRTPVSDFKSFVSEGKREDIGTEVPLVRTKVNAYDSYPTPASHRTAKQQGNGR